MSVQKETPIHAFTIDVEEWFQGIELTTEKWAGKEERIYYGMDYLLNLLKATDTKATFFVLGQIAKRHPKLVKKIAAEGHEIGSHGMNHEKVFNMTPEKFKNEETEVKTILEDLTGTGIMSFRAPYFSITKDSLWALDILADLSYRYDCSISPVVTWRYGIEGAPEGIYLLERCGIVEYTISSWTMLGRRFASGGAYFRIFPPFLTFRPYQCAKSGMFYAHPWEYDPDHPVIDIDWKTRITHYCNLQSMRKRTERLLNQFKFGTVKGIVAKKNNLATVSEASFEINPTET